MGGVGRMGMGTEGGDLEVSQARDKLRSGAHNNAQPPKALSTLTLTLHDRSVHAAPINVPWKIPWDRATASVVASELTLGELRTLSR